MAYPPSAGRSGQAAGRRSVAGFTLLEAIMAAVILSAVVLGVISAVMAGFQHAHEARQHIAASLAVDDLAGRIMATPYASVISTWDGYSEGVGEMTDAQGSPLPVNFSHLGREVSVSATTRTLPKPAVEIHGLEVVVEAVDVNGRTIAQMTLFIPEPQS